MNFRNKKCANSYIVVENDIIIMQCEECFAKNQKGYFWSGELGYGNRNIYCQCGNIINEVCTKPSRKDQSLDS